MSLKIENLSIGFENQMLFTGLNGQVENGQSLAVLGCNGTGKSSLLQVLANTIPTIEGNIIFDNKSKIYYLAQNLNIRRDISISVRDFVNFAKISNKNVKPNEIDEILNKLGIKSIENDFLTNISGGQLMLANLARIDLMNVDIIILDEPFASLDKDVSQILLKLFDEWRAKGKIIIVSIHDDRLAQGFDHFLTLNGKQAFWEKNCPKHSEDCVLSHNHNHFHHHNHSEAL